MTNYSINKSKNFQSTQDLLKMVSGYSVLLPFVIHQIQALTCHPSSSPTVCDVRCNAGGPSSYNECKYTNLDCPAGLSCEVDCRYVIDNDRRRIISKPSVNPNPNLSESKLAPNKRNLLQAVYTCSSGSNYGCCGSILNCAAGEYCEIDCEYGCNGVIINATTASSLKVL